jgi:hypothetical protein
LCPNDNIAIILAAVNISQASKISQFIVGS